MAGDSRTERFNRPAYTTKNTGLVNDTDNVFEGRKTNQIYEVGKVARPIRSLPLNWRRLSIDITKILTFDRSPSSDRSCAQTLQYVYS